MIGLSELQNILNSPNNQINLPRFDFNQIFNLTNLNIITIPSPSNNSANLLSNRILQKTSTRPSTKDTRVKNTISIESVFKTNSKVLESNHFTRKKMTSSFGFSLPSQVTPIENNVIKGGTTNLTISPIAINKSISKITRFYDRVLQITSKQWGQTTKPPLSTGEITINKLSWNEFNGAKRDIIKNRSSEINLFKLNSIQTGVLQNNTSKITFPSLISSDQFFGSNIHNSNLQTLNQLNNSVNHIWSTLIPQTDIDITYEIKDLPSGQLAEATITGFDSQGKPNAGIIKIDHDANGAGWFIDQTPFANEEYSINNTDWAFQATPDSPAYGKYDLLTTILHEAAHLYGFMGGYSEFDKNVRYKNGKRTFIGDNFTALLSVDGSHLDKRAHPHDLLNTHLAPSIRKLPSDINVLILNAIQNTKTDTYHTLIPQTDNHDHDLVPPLQRGARGDSSLDFNLSNSLSPSEEEVGISLTAPLTSSGLMAEILNGDFAISNNTNPDYGWNNRGAATVKNDRAILTEDSSYLSNFTQSFIVPENSQTLQFSFNAQLGNGDTNNTILPPDAFEVALLDANTNQPILGNTLSNTDSFFNLQNDGTAYFDDRVRIGGTSSGEQLTMDNGQLTINETVTVDISDIPSGTEVTLYFDLLGFGDADSTIYLDNVKIDNQSVTAPLALNDLISINQGENIAIDVLANDSDRDGTLIPNSLQITSQPSNGVITVNSQGIVDYQPNSEFVGLDRFTYTVEDNDGNLSNQATVTVLVNNSAPVIEEIIIDDTILEILNIKNKLYSIQ